MRGAWLVVAVCLWAGCKNKGDADAAPDPARHRHRPCSCSLPTDRRRRRARLHASPQLYYSRRMLLYHDPTALNPRRVRIFLAEKGVAYDTIEVSIAKGANLTDEYRKKNPISLLPVLELSDGRILRESMAICRFLEEEYPTPNLFGATA